MKPIYETHRCDFLTKFLQKIMHDGDVIVLKRHNKKYYVYPNKRIADKFLKGINHET